MILSKHIVWFGSQRHKMGEMKIPIEVSARHVHLSQRLVNILFGEEHQLTPEKSLSQTTEFCSVERVDIVGSREIVHNVAVLGPTREHTQVEISLTDARELGLKPPVRESGNHEGSVGCRLVGPCGEYELEDGVIVARRHIHCNPSEADELGVKDGDIVSVEVKEALRPVIFKEVLVRVREDFSLSMHVDTDEGNAAGLSSESYGVIWR